MNQLDKDERMVCRDRHQRPGFAPVMYQRWQNLLFLHWTFDPVDVQRLLPPGLTLDTWEGNAWVGVVPFEMRNIRPWWSPVVPYISNFLELNLRTYVIDEQGRPGVYFISLNADRWVACMCGRWWFRLPYHWSSMRCQHLTNGSVDYHFRRFGAATDTACHYRYQPMGTPSPAAPGTLEYFLVERYFLFTQRGQQLCYGQVHHPPYPVQTAELEICENRFLSLDGLPNRSDPPVHVAYVTGVNVDVFPLIPV